MKFPRLYFQLWDRDIIKYNDCAGEGTIDLSEIYRNSYENNVAVNYNAPKKKEVKRLRQKQNIEKVEKEDTQWKDNPLRENDKEKKTIPAIIINDEQPQATEFEVSKLLKKWFQSLYEECHFGSDDKLLVDDVYEEFKNSQLFTDDTSGRFKEISIAKFRSLLMDEPKDSYRTKSSVFSSGNHLTGWRPSNGVLLEWFQSLYEECHFGSDNKLLVDDVYEEFKNSQLFTDDTSGRYKEVSIAKFRSLLMDVLKDRYRIKSSVFSSGNHLTGWRPSARVVLLKWFKSLYEECHFDSDNKLLDSDGKLLVDDVYEEFKNSQLFTDDTSERFKEISIAKFRSLLMDVLKDCYRTSSSCFCSSAYLAGYRPIIHDIADFRDPDEAILESLRKYTEGFNLWSTSTFPHSHKIEIFRVNHNSKDRKPKSVGTVIYSVQVWPKEKAKSMPVGQGRKEPNHSPYLPPPTGRMKWYHYHYHYYHLYN